MPTDPTTIRLAEIEARLAAATPSPWYTFDNGFDAGVGAGECKKAGWGVNGEYPDTLIAGGEPYEGRMEPNNPDTKLIAAAPGDLTFCLTLIREQAARIAELEI